MKKIGFNLISIYLYKGCLKVYHRETIRKLVFFVFSIVTLYFIAYQRFGLMLKIQNKTRRAEIKKSQKVLFLRQNFIKMKKKQILEENMKKLQKLILDLSCIKGSIPGVIHGKIEIY